ncbi:MAG: hypothetical protein JRN20_00085 [Nitrososphaerota archaeon]|nr:hypothetical protein [Nitrososphaerota archaeon]
MISYSLAVFSIAGATLIPTFLALYLITNLKIPTRYLGALGLGLALWFFFDTFNDAIQLDVNQAFTGGLDHVAHVFVFWAGIATLAVFDYFAVRKPNLPLPQNGTVADNATKCLVLVPIGIAFVMGIHSLGEGWDFGGASGLAQTETITNAFGNLSALASYPMHKFLESIVVACAYAIYVERSGAVKKWWHLLMLGLLFGGTSVVGTALGYYNPAVDTTYFFAFGVTSAFYAILRLSESISLNFKIGENAPSYLGWKIFFTVMIGFFLLYFAALFH